MKVLPSTAVTLALLIASGTLVSAQVTEDCTAAPIIYSKGSYTVHEDGSLFFEGDMIFTCDDLPRLIRDSELPSARGLWRRAPGSDLRLLRKTARYPIREVFLLQSRSLPWRSRPGSS